MQIYTGAPQQLRLVVVGAYTAEMGGSGSGITCFTVADTDAPVRLRIAGQLDLPSPSYLIPHPDQPWLLAVSETRPSRLSVLSIAGDGSMEVLSSVETGGDWACHLALSPDRRHVLVTNYASGSVSAFRLDDHGRLAISDLHSFTGSGPHPERQEGPHAHQVVHDPATDEWLVADLGTDRIHRLTLDDHERFQPAGQPVMLPAGAGPRHLVIDDDVMIIACELSAQLWIGTRNSSGWRSCGLVESSRLAVPGTTTSALRIDQRTVAVANRGPGTISWFHLDRRQDRPPTLAMINEEPCHGPIPRDLVLTDEYAWVANQTSGTLVLLPRPPIDSIDDDPTPAKPWAPSLTVEITTPSPACIVLLAGTP